VPRDFSFPLDTDELWERLEPICLADRKLLTLSPEDVLLILCVHGAKHLWTYLGGVCDVAELIRAHPAMNWARVLEQASLLRSERMLFLGLFLAIALLGASVPKQIEQRVLADRALALLATRVCQRLFRETGRPPGGLESSLFHLKARERLWDGVRYGLSLAMAPTVADWALVRVPPAFSFLYYLIRPMRLAGRYGRNLLKQLT